ncbi:protealysin inhibitor emfourin [Actinacidiphila sp. bgisy167]|uniref:protealysin inhibitor emfourin n=1 Tax=Actinacidiphila sp. bgisy167 TaxID=3413797 RepID=UPI003D7305DC
MRIQVIRSGGFAGIERRAVLDTAGRPDALRLEALAREVLAAAGKPDEPAAGVPDGFRYAITVDGRTVHCADPRLTEEQRELVRLVLKEGARS